MLAAVAALLVAAGVAVAAYILLLPPRTATGVATETRSLRLDGEAGRLTLHVEGLHSARAAAGYRRDNRFIPLLRAPQV